jgi:hypothetical protein
MKLIRTNALRGLVEAEAGSPITDRWTEISALIGSRCGSDVAQLFAEPSISRSNGASESIARWYSDADGPAVSYSALDAGARGATAAHLTSVLARLEPLLRDPQTAPLVGPMVQIPSMADVMVVGGRPVIVNWGFLPETMVTSPVQREAHFRSTLGQFLPGVSVPAFNAGRVAPVAAMVSPAGSAPVRPAVGAVPAAAAVIPPVVTREVVRRDRSWIPIAIATAVALIVLLVLLIPGVLLYPDQSSASADDLEKVRQANRTLETRIEELKRQLTEQSCTAQSPTGTGTPPATPAPPANPPSASPPAITPPAATPPAATPPPITLPPVTPPPSGNAPTNGPTPSPVDQAPPPEPSTK